MSLDRRRRRAAMSWSYDPNGIICGPSDRRIPSKQAGQAGPVAVSDDGSCGVRAVAWLLEWMGIREINCLGGAQQKLKARQHQLIIERDLVGHYRYTRCCCKEGGLRGGSFPDSFLMRQMPDYPTQSLPTWLALSGDKQGTIICSAEINLSHFCPPSAKQKCNRACPFRFLRRHRLQSFMKNDQKRC